MRYVILSIFSSLVGSPQAGNTGRCAGTIFVTPNVGTKWWKKVLGKRIRSSAKRGEKKEKKIILLIRILRRAVCFTVPRIYIYHLASRIAAYLQVEAPARHPQLFVDVTYTCVITDMQLSLRIHPTRAALAESGPRNSSTSIHPGPWCLFLLSTTLSLSLSPLPFTCFSSFWPLPCFWRSFGLIYASIGSCGLLIGPTALWMKWKLPVHFPRRFSSFINIKRRCMFRFKSVIIRFVYLAGNFPRRVRGVVVESVDAWLKHDGRDKVVITSWR